MNDIAEPGHKAEMETGTSSPGSAITHTEAAADRIAGQLRETIISGAIVSGRALVEAELCVTYGASRNTVREALRQLRTEGLLVSIRHRGVVVKTLTQADVRDIYRVRRTVELSAIRHSVYAPDALLAEVLNAIHSEASAVTEQRWGEVGTWSLRFHQAIVALLQSQRLNEFFRTVVAQLRLIFALYHDEQGFQSQWVARDREIQGLIAGGQPQAAENAMKLYLDDSEARVLEIVRYIHSQATDPHAPRTAQQENR